MMGSGGQGPWELGMAAVLIFCLGGGIVWFWKDSSVVPIAVNNLPSEQQQELILLKSENNMLKSMLGQVDGKVVILGPTSSGRKAYGKVVWDETLQSGFLYVTQLGSLSPSEVYQLSMGAGGKPLVKCCTFSPDADGRAQQAFIPLTRMLGVTEFAVTIEKGSGFNPPKGERVLEAKITADGR